VPPIRPRAANEARSYHSSSPLVVLGIPRLAGYIQRINPYRAPLMVTQLPELRNPAIRPVVASDIRISQDTRICVTGENLNLTGSLLTCTPKTSPV